MLPALLPGEGGGWGGGPKMRMAMVGWGGQANWELAAGMKRKTRSFQPSMKFPFMTQP